MYYLIYASSATSLMDEDQLLAMLEEFRTKNEKLGITGMLIYKGGNFMQLLEGDKDDVLQLYDAICQDPRHKLVTNILSGEVAERQFPNWSMGFFNMDKVAGLPDFDSYFEQAMNAASFPAETKSAYQFITRFNNWIH